MEEYLSAVTGLWNSFFSALLPFLHPFDHTVTLDQQGLHHALRHRLNYCLAIGDQLSLCQLSAVSAHVSVLPPLHAL